MPFMLIALLFLGAVAKLAGDLIWKWKWGDKVGETHRPDRR